MLRGNRGFTTVEIVIVAALLSLVVAKTNSTINKQDKKMENLEQRTEECDKLEEYLYKYDKHPGR